MLTPRSTSTHPPGIDAARAISLARDAALTGDALYANGHTQAAIDQFANAVRLQPTVPDYHFRVASAAWKLNRAAEVETHYLQAVRLDPRFGEAHKKLAQWFVQRGQVELAVHHSAEAMAIDPADIDTQITRAVVLTADGQSQSAWEILEPLINSGVVNWHLASAYADLAHRIGHKAQAVALIERTLRETQPSATTVRRLHVSAASLLESAGRYDEAFAHMRSAKQLISETFDLTAYSKWVSHALAYFTKRKMRSLPRATHDNSRPILIVGMPRSGTSLIEQILASHPAIHGGGELRLIGDIVDSFSVTEWSKQVGYPDCLDLLSINEANRLADRYVGGIQAMNSSATYVTDKMPQNYEYLGLIELLLPECRIIHCMRDPRDTCLSCFLTDFDRGHAFSRELSHLASYYRDYERFMAHWKTVLSIPVLDVRYEDLTSEPDVQIRRMLKFLNLSWDPRCLAFHENKRTVITASRDQVRQPLYSSSVGRWKRYEKNIPELLELMGSAQAGA